MCVWWGVDVCWTALTVRPFQAYITEPAGLLPIATLTEVKGYVPHPHNHPPTNPPPLSPPPPPPLLAHHGSHGGLLIPWLATDRAAAPTNLNLTWFLTEWLSHIHRHISMRFKLWTFCFFAWTSLLLLPFTLVLNCNVVEHKTCINEVTLRILPNSPHPRTLSPPDMITKGRCIKDSVT